MARHRLSLTAASLLGVPALVLPAGGTASQSGGSSSSSKTASIQIWEGYTGPEATEFAKLVKQYEKANPGEKVSSLYVNNDNTLQKVTTAVQGGSPPDIAYLYGSWAPNVATIPKVVDLTQVVKQSRPQLVQRGQFHHPRQDGRQQQTGTQA